jgi:hypothetical protein
VQRVRRRPQKSEDVELGTHRASQVVAANHAFGLRMRSTCEQQGGRGNLSASGPEAHARVVLPRGIVEDGELLVEDLTRCFRGGF